MAKINFKEQFNPNAPRAGQFVPEEDQHKQESGSLLRPDFNKEDPEHPLIDPGEVTNTELRRAVFESLAEGIGFGQGSGLIYRDLKPKKLATERCRAMYREVMEINGNMLFVNFNSLDDFDAYEIAVAENTPGGDTDLAIDWLALTAVQYGLLGTATFDEVKAVIPDIPQGV